MTFDKSSSFLKITIIYCVFAILNADIYLHNPRGSNNRLAEAGRARNNANRMFNSQNNNRGGYNVGSLYYYSGSNLRLEWTNQHSCNNKISNCDFIIQYMCDDSIRDGSDTRTIPENDSQCQGDCNSDMRFGMNENQDYYNICKRRIRNKGLFVAEQNLRDPAIFTRQNPNGNRYGYECPEERDYYPYWHPTNWIDIAILTNDPKRCDYYKKESENVKGRFYCLVPNEYKGSIPNSKAACEKIRVSGNKTAEWKQSPSHGTQAPHCQETQFTRDNHLGNTIGANTPFFNWKIPNIDNERCVLRVRYNISTNDYESDLNGLQKVDLTKKMGLSTDEAQKRGYTFKTNPTVKLFDDLDMDLNLAINTQQYGRVFQDRSHVFGVRSRPEELKNKNIYNLNVRGKRGNIVQVYPGVEYDFVPNRLETSKNDYIHIQWTGSNTNPNNNDGQGTPGSDRSNILLLNPKEYEKGTGFNLYQSLSVYGQYGLNYPTHLLNSTLLGFSNSDLIKLAILEDNQYGGNMDELNDAGTYFDLGPRQLTSSGVFHYMSSRNNNFSNRDQKGILIIQDNEFHEELFDSNGGVIQTDNVIVDIPEGSFDKLTDVRIDVKSKEQILKDLNTRSDNEAISNLKNFDISDLASDFVMLKFPGKAKYPLKVTVKIKNKPGAMSSTNSYRISSDFSAFTKISIKSSTSEQLIFETQEAGNYVAKNESDYSVLIGSLIGVALFAILVVSGIIFIRRNPKFLQRMRYSAANAKLSVSNKI